MRPLFSVIVPAYNAEPFLSRGVESVLGQTCGDWELLLVDDGSQDGTLALCRTYAEKDLRVRVFHQSNQGHTSARNLGLENSRGAYVLFMDSDDWLDLRTLEVCGEVIREHEPEVLVYGLCIHEGTRQRVWTGRFPEGAYSPADPESPVRKSLLMDADGQFAFPKCLNGKVFRREAVMPYQMAVPRDVRMGEDGACFTAAAFHAEKLWVTSGASYHYQVREGSVSRTGDAFALRRCLSLLGYYREQLAMDDPVVDAQYRRMVVGHLYTALQLTARSERGEDWLRREWETVLGSGTVRAALSAARFGWKGWKMKVKQLVLRFGLLWLVRPLMKREMR